MTKEIGYTVKCSKGEVIKLHDVCRCLSTNEIIIVSTGVNIKHDMFGLTAVNEVTDAGDWLSVYPDGELEVLANLEDGTKTVNKANILRRGWYGIQISNEVETYETRNQRTEREK